jgi:uncharacterized protein
MADTDSRTNVVAWFEIPSRDFARAVGFYETLLATTLRQESFGGPRMAVFPYQQPGVGGAIVEPGQLQPGGTGTVIYLNCDGQLDAILARVEPAGGTFAGPKIDLPAGMGSFIHVLDTEGNRIGLHAH